MSKSSAARVLEITDPEPVEAKEPDEMGTVEKMVATQGISPAESARSLYPKGTELFSWNPKGGGETLLLPMEFEKPDKVWLWDQAKLPFLSQTFRWMEKANVPNDIQRKVCALPDDEYMEMFGEWFKAMGGGATPGE